MMPAPLSTRPPARMVTTAPLLTPDCALEHLWNMLHDHVVIARHGPAVLNPNKAVLFKLLLSYLVSTSSCSFWLANGLL